LNAIIQRVWEYVRSNPKKLIAIVAVVIVAAVMLFDDYGLWRRASMEAENRRLLDVQAQAERRMVENELRIRNVGNPDSVEKAARERYNFRREGERLLHYQKITDPPQLRLPGKPARDMYQYRRRLTREVLLAPFRLGVSAHQVESMTNTHTADVEATVAQCRRLSLAGAKSYG